MHGALIFTRFGLPGLRSAGLLQPLGMICPPKSCSDLVVHIEGANPGESGWCPAMWCNSVVSPVPARIFLKTCDVGYYSNSSQLGMGCVWCDGYTVVYSFAFWAEFPWTGVGSTGCKEDAKTALPTTAPTRAPATALPTAAPTATPTQGGCSHVIEGDFGGSCSDACGGFALCDVHATAELAVGADGGLQLLKNRTSFFEPLPTTSCVNTIQAIRVEDFHPGDDQKILSYARAPYIEVTNGLPPDKGHCASYQLVVPRLLAKTDIESACNKLNDCNATFSVLESACNLKGSGGVRRICCCSAAPPSPSPAAAAPKTSPLAVVGYIASALVCLALTACVAVCGFVASLWVRARRRRDRMRNSELLGRSGFGAFGHARMWTSTEMTPRVSAMSEISMALLQPAATSASSANSADSLASDDERARRIVEQGLWIDPGTIVVGRKLAAGGMGELRLGRMTLPAERGKRGSKTKVTVVLKSSFIEMLGGDADEFWHEASMLSQIKHPQVVRLFGVTQKEVRGMLKAETKNRLFLVMEYCANGSLTDAVRKPGGYNRKRDFLRHAEQITSTLAWLHAQGIVHRDIKPSNVLLDDGGNAKLCDLGLSRFQPGIGPGASPSVGFTSATMTVGAGSAPYMPPEGLADTEPGQQGGGEEVPQRHYDGRAWDIYSLAILLSQMWTGKELYKGLGVFQIVVRVSQGMRPKLATDPREVPPRLLEIVSTMWDADRHARPSAEEVLAMLREGGVLAAQIEDVRH